MRRYVSGGFVLRINLWGCTVERQYHILYMDFSYLVECDTGTFYRTDIRWVRALVELSQQVGNSEIAQFDQ